MTKVKTSEGQTIQTDLSPEAVADLQAETPAKVEEPQKPAPEVSEPKETPAEAKAETPDQPEALKGEDGQLRDESGKFIPKEYRPEKPKPIANLLAKKHELESALGEKDKTIADLQAKIEELSQRPASPATDNKAKALAEKYGLDQTFVEDLMQTFRGAAELPSEVKDLIEKAKLNEALETERQAFDDRLNRMAKTFPNEPILKHKDKLLELAYSDGKAPDGEPYFKKELAELYFGFIKPEVEPGRISGEQGQAPGATRTEVVDFAAMLERDDPKEFEKLFDEHPEMLKKFQEWQSEHARANRGKKPITIG